METADLLDLSGYDWSQPTPVQTFSPQITSSPQAASEPSQSPSSAPKPGQASGCTPILRPDSVGLTPIITTPEVADEDPDVWSMGGLWPIPEVNESTDSTRTTNTPAPASPPLSIKLSPLAEPFKSARAEKSSLETSPNAVGQPLPSSSPFSSSGYVARSPRGNHDLMHNAIADWVKDNSGSRDGPFDRHSPLSVSQRSTPSFHSIPTLVPVRISDPTVAARSPVTNQVTAINDSSSSSPPRTGDIKNSGLTPTPSPSGDSFANDATLPSNVHPEEDPKSPISRLTASLSAISLSQDMDTVDEDDREKKAPSVAYYATPGRKKPMLSVSPTSTAPLSSPTCTPVPPPTPDEPHSRKQAQGIVNEALSKGADSEGVNDTSPELDTAGQPKGSTGSAASLGVLDVASEEPDEAVLRHLSVQLWNPHQQRLSGLADLWKECWATLEDFSKGFQDAIERLQPTSASPVPTNNHEPTLKALQAHVALLTARVTVLQSERKAVAERLAASHRKCIALEEELSSAHALEEALHRQLQNLQAAKERETKLKSELTHQYLLLEEQFMGFKRQYEPKKAFALVLFEGHHTMFDPALIRNGYRGGRQMGARIEAALSSLCRLDDLPVGTTAIVLHLFLDVPATAKALLESGVIENRRELYGFLDGFSAHSGLFTVVDTEGPDGPATKITDHIELYSGVNACSTIVLAAKEYEPYRTLIDGLSDSGHPKLRAVRSTPDSDDDPFAVLGQDRLVYIGGVFLMNADSGSPRIDLAAEDDGLSRVTTPQPGDRVRSNVPDSPETARLLARPWLISPLTGYRRQSPFPPSPPLPPLGNKPAAPWARHDVSSSPPLETPLPSRPVTKGTLLDQYYSSQSDSSRASSVAGSDRTASPPAEAATLPALAKPSLRDRMYGTELRVPIDASEGSIGGSPPESDEDEPSVPLPHSALKFVQRPTSFSTSPAPSTSSRDSTYPTTSSSRPTKSAPRFGDRGATTLGSNNIPLGTTSGKWGAQRDSGDRVHGFKRHPHAHIFQ